MSDLKGTGVALITPFTENGAVDTNALTELVNFNIEAGVDYLVVLGTTAETVTLNASEKQMIIDTVVLATKNRVPLVLGMGSNNTAALIEDLQRQDLSDFDAILSVTPYYNKPSQRGLIAHFKAVAESTSKDIILYNVPGRTGVDMSVETIVELSTIPNIIGIKEAAGSIEKIQQLVARTEEDFLVISGDDATASQTVLVGGDGVISVLGQALPKEFSTMINAGLNGDIPQAEELDSQLAALSELIFEEGNPSGIKVLCSHLGYGTAKVRLPLVEASSGLESKLITALELQKSLSL
ncbi:MAG: 4-hydroxy-tetrahydrodipicolinate synthase [Flavobacteriaceae bacterium]|nr:4-hydroxy-tetrahydrodipicolinate synthase [Flavobacteriaceae bacterium]NVJ73239.1 4-hydroxy-tetrahydrodipicolinate synthase [Flavobacteriaceae bacterium]